MAMDIEVETFANIASRSECDGTDCNKKRVWYLSKKSGKRVSVMSLELSGQSNNHALDPFGKRKRDLSEVQGVCVNETWSRVWNANSEEVEVKPSTQRQKSGQVKYQPSTRRRKSGQVKYQPSTQWRKSGQVKPSTQRQKSGQVK